MAGAKCQKCGAEVEVPDNLPQELRAEASLLAGKLNRFGVIQLLGNGAKLPLKQSKAIAIHLSGEGHTCHRCKEKLPSEEEVVCVKCGSFNLNW